MTLKNNILIAEDDAVLRDLYVRKFGKAGYIVRTAANGEETLDMIKRAKPDVLLLDLNMPILDGFGVLEKLSKEQGTFPVIVLTNFGDQANRERGAALGVTDYFMKKDMTIQSLLDMVNKLLTKQ